MLNSANLSMPQKHDDSTNTNANDNQPVIAFSWGGINFSLAEITEPNKIGEDKTCQIVDKLCNNLYYAEYYDGQRGPYDLKFTHKLAEIILQAKRDGGYIEEALESSGLFCSYGQDDSLYADADKEAESLADEIAAAREDHDIDNSWDQTEFQEDYRDRAIESTRDKDDSSILDLIGRYDKVEIGFILSQSDSIEDDCITSSRQWASYAELCIEDGLAGAFARIGYSLKEYRDHSGSQMKNESTGKHKVWDTRLATLDQIHELVDNACSQFFIFMIYAQVSLTDLIKADINQPLMLSKYAIASYNGWSGTFHDICIDAPLVIDPKRAFLHLPGANYSPDNICGLAGSAYTADLSN